ncbi:hypothetical protein Ais01nite_11780 [Asanoa ishikariensis]|uniref:Uncharacterized protein n=1 Tax=Asanoa ishikariensis TaxID=137265 RepID=A0A1H3T0W4_9ACTN|nr:hypothetical protein [Asanoa ishikariensis]GIF63143.1 hypothetical protein Ais01nite_11780 [Asanoa ishikariensis]SDZ43993.1 hypothetical protein SAMN05421684_5049 [Asanoa ishikariensis]
MPLPTVLIAALLALPAGVTVSTANSVATGDQDGGAVATNRNGDVAVVWEDDRAESNPGDNTNSEIYVRLFRNGTSAYEKKLSAGGTAGVKWKHVSPDVGLDDKGNTVVVWNDDPDGNGTYNVVYRVISPAGTVLGQGQVNADSAGQQLSPKVAVDPDGTASNPSSVAFSVVWEDVQGTVTRVKAAGYSNVATKLYEVLASQSTGAHHLPDIAVSASGDALIVWDEDSDGNGFFQIGLVRLARGNGAVTLTRRAANSNGGGQQRHPAIAANFTGDFTVAWESDHTGTPGIWSRSFAANGDPKHGDVEVTRTAGAATPAVGIDDQANTVVGWTVQGQDVWARGFNPNGTTDGRLPAQTYSNVTTGRQDQLSLAVSPWGEIVVSYTDDNDGNLYDQVLLALGGSNSQW